MSARSIRIGCRMPRPVISQARLCLWLGDLRDVLVHLFLVWHLVDVLVQNRQKAKPTPTKQTQNQQFVTLCMTRRGLSRFCHAFVTLLSRFCHALSRGLIMFLFPRFFLRTPSVTLCMTNPAVTFCHAFVTLLSRCCHAFVTLLSRCATVWTTR